MASKPNVARLYSCFATGADSTVALIEVSISPGIPSTVLSCGNSCGEGWFLTAEMIELIQDGVPNIICAQPFACLPNHVTGKGMIKELRRQYPMSNIVPIDYDPGASEANQLNRIKLMISTARAVREQEIENEKKAKEG